MHGRGKSLTDLIRQRRGDLGRMPDVVVRPADEDEVAAVVGAALEENAVVIPFGGGSSISGSLQAEPGETRPVISIDMGRLNRVLWVDATSQLACVQAGVFGPDLERQLNAQGWTCGHFPDSFAHSTLGGWIATRSSGMQSDRYGDVAELTRGLRVVTPSGMLAVRPVPSTSTGPSVREMVLGSEGRLGVITEATIHVRRVPPERRILGYLFPTWAAGLAAMRDIAASEASPSVTRVSDAHESAFSFAMRNAPTPLDRIKSKALQAFLRRRGWDLEAMCLSFIGYEGSANHVAAQRKLSERIVKRHGGLGIGRSPGELYDQKKFDTPYIRDFLLDRGAPADVSETSAPWSELQTVYNNVMAAGHGAFDAAWRTRLSDVPPVALLPRGCLPLLHVRAQPAQGARRLGGLRRGEVCDPAGLRGLGRHAVPPPCGRYRARPVAGGGHLNARCRDAARAVRGDRPRREPQPGQDRRGRSRSAARREPPGWRAE